MPANLLTPEHLTMITTGFLVGTYARYSTVEEDYRQFPSYPNGYLIHLVTGAVAAAIGAVALPALLTNNFVGVSFLALAIQQFRDVRKMEKGSLQALEDSEQTARGNAYIDGISKTFEARNYFSLITSFACVVTMYLLPGHRPLFDIPAGAAVGLILIWLLRRLTKGKTIGDICDVQKANIRFEEDRLFVEDISVANVALPDVRERFLKEGLAVMITPRTVGGQIVLANAGQRQAIVHEATRTLGKKRYLFQRKNFDDGRVCFAFLPIRRDEGALLEIVRNVPILESSNKTERIREPNILPQSKES